MDAFLTPSTLEFANLLCWLKIGIDCLLHMYSPSFSPYTDYQLYRNRVYGMRNNIT